MRAKLSFFYLATWSTYISNTQSKEMNMTKANYIVKYTSSVGNKFTICFIDKNNMDEWINAVTLLNKMSGTIFTYTIEDQTGR